MLNINHGKKQKAEYVLNGTRLGSVRIQQDWISLRMNHKVNMQIQKAIRKVNCMLVFITKDLEYNRVRKPDCNYVEPHQEYSAVLASLPINIFKNYLRRAKRITRVIIGW